MIKTDLFKETEARKVVRQLGSYSILEYTKDISVNPTTAQTAYFMSEMNVRKKQLVATLNNTGIIMQAGAMQMMIGNIEASTNVKGVGGFFKSMAGGAVTGESGIKPLYFGYGHVVFEPTYRYIILDDLANWGGAVTVEDGLFLSCNDTVQIKTTHRSNVSSAVAGGEGFFNTTLVGQGIVALESYVPSEELVLFELNNDTLKIDGNMAIAWSPNLNFTVERTTKTLIGSAASGEGLVNVYRGTGRVLVAPVC